MQISARTDYSIRALVCLAAHTPDTISVGALAIEQDLPLRFLETILSDLRRAGLVRVKRGSGGYVLARPPDEVTLGAIVRAIDGPLIEIRGLPLDEATYSGVAANLSFVWQAVDASLKRVYDGTTLAQIVTNTLSDYVRELIEPIAPPPESSHLRAVETSA